MGHLAVALGARSAEPRLPLGAAVAAAFGLDLLWPILLLAGLESVRVSPGDTAFTQLAFDSYPWSHSLAMTLLWSVLIGLLTRRVLGSGRLGWILALLVASHWFLDLVTHRPDLPLWPAGPEHGLGLWRSIPATLVVEGTLIAVAVTAYARATDPRDRAGSVGLYGLVTFCTLLWVTSPWAPPPPSASAVAWGSLVLWLLPPWSSWIDRHRSAAHRNRPIPERP